ncbi:MAG: site-2 protease family protein [Chloroflexi bacterium]|nr:MAG: site-2 protease family protein [Chloroflexota bacterium]
MTGPQAYITAVVYALPGLIIGFTLHELAHAATAVRLGDPTPRRLGRLTLDPREHVDPVGLGLLLTVGFGWAKPVVFSPAYIRTGLQQAAVAAAGPLTNLLLAVVFAVALHAELATSSTLLDRAVLNMSLGQGGPDVILFNLLVEAFFVNVVLFVFNSLPVPGLDGYATARGLLGRQLPDVFRWMEANRQLIYLGLILLIFVLPQFQGGVNPLYSTILHVNDFLYHHFVDSSSTVVGSLPNIFNLFQQQ